MKESRGVGFKETITVFKALQKWLERNRVKVGSEKIKVEKTVGRIVFKDIISTKNIPSYNRSAMDGFAVRAEDVYDVSALNPVTLKVKGRIPVEGPLKLSVETGVTIEVSTGSPIPEGADAVVKLEQVKRLKEGVQILSSVRPFENIIRKGTDFRKGEEILKKGFKVTTYDLSVLKVMGIEEIDVAQKPLVAIGTTGRETVESAKDACGFKVVDINRPTLIQLVKEAGGKFLDIGIIGDRLDDIAESVNNVVHKCHLIILTGGTSVGLKDNTAAAIKSLKNSELIAHGISMRPGMPTGLWIVDGKPVATLPGSPVAAFITFLYLVKPMMYHIMDAKKEETCRVKASLTRRISSPIGVRSYIRVKVKRTDKGLEADPVAVHGSTMISSMVKANGILEVPENIEGYEARDKVDVTLIKPIVIEGD